MIKIVFLLKFGSAEITAVREPTGILHNLQMFISELENKTNHFKENYLIPHDGYFFNYVLIYVVTL